MDTLTHALSGALIAAATGRRQSQTDELTVRRRAAIGFLAAAFPDSDYVLSFIDPMLYLNAHRGVTHSLLMLPLWSLLLAGLFTLLFRRWGLPWRAYLGVSAMAIAIHIAGDTVTSFGTQLFAPLTDWKAALNTTFIIDLWFSGIILVALLLALWRQGPRSAQIGLAGLTLYVAGQGLSEWKALEYAKDYRQRMGLAAYQVEAFPQPASPLRWKLMVSNGSDHHTAYLDFDPSQPEGDGYFARLARGYRGGDALQWQVSPLYPEGDEHGLAVQVWAQGELEGFRRFAAYPAFSRAERSEGRQCAWFTDLRFGGPGATPPFRFGLCRSGGGDWVLNRLPRRFGKRN